MIDDLRRREVLRIRLERMLRAAENIQRETAELDLDGCASADAAARPAGGRRRQVLTKISTPVVEPPA